MKHCRSRSACVAVLFGGLISSHALAQTTSPAVDVQKDVVYGNAGGVELKLDIVRPTVDGPARPCVVLVHGGGWSGGDKAGHAAAARTLAAKGYVAASVNYRMMPAFRFPAPIEDVKCAVRYLRANAAKYGIDPDRIGAAGDSAGGHLVMMLGVTTAADGLEGDGGSPGVSSAVRAVVSYYGPGDLAAPDTPELGQGIIKQFLDGTPAEKPEECRKASPISYVHAGEPPMLLLQGTGDPIVLYSQAVRMAAAMTKAKAPGRVELLNGAGHGFTGADQRHAIEATAAFFDEHLRAGK